MVVTNGNSNGQSKATSSITVQDLASELNMTTEQVKAFLVAPELKSDDVVQPRKVEQLRRTYGALKNPVSSSLVASPELDKSEIKENLQELSKQLDAPQKMISAIAQHQFKLLLEGTAQQAFLQKLAEAKGKKDAEEFIARQQQQEQARDLNDKLQEIADQNQMLNQLKDYYTSYVSPEQQESHSKLAEVYNKITAHEADKQDFLRRVAEGEPVTEQERQRFFW